MEPITHGLASVALGRAGLNKLSPKGTLILVVAGYAPDWDWIFLFSGAQTLYDYRRVLGHNVFAMALAAVGVAALFWLIGGRHPKHPIRFLPALWLSLAGVASHALLDLPNRYGMQLFWPVTDKWFAWYIVESIDPLPLTILAAGLLLPALFRMVSEEIGARHEDRGPRRWAAAALALVVLYAGGRVALRERAEGLLRGRVYRGLEPVAVAAYPTPLSPLRWRGIVETERTLEEMDVNIQQGVNFRPENAGTSFKPDPSPMLEAARATPTVQKFLRFAKFPVARVNRTEKGYKVEIRDARFSEEPTRWGGFMARVEMDDEFRVTREQVVSIPRVRPD